MVSVLLQCRGATDTDFGKYPVKPEQYKAMASLVAGILKSWGHGPEYVTRSNVLTHSEAGTDGDSMGRYGPTAEGGTGERWDLWKLFEGDAGGTGGNKIRNMIKSAFNGAVPAVAPTPIGDPITITDYDMDGKINIKDVNWWTNILKNKPKTGQTVKFGETDKYKIYDGKGWTDYDPKTKGTGITSQTLAPTPGSTFDTSKPKPKEKNTSFLGGIFDSMKGIPFLGEFIEGFEEGFSKESPEGSNARGIIDFLFGDKGKNKSIDSGSGGGVFDLGQTSSSPLTGDTADKAKMMYDYIVSKGYSPAQSKGIVANIQRESTFDAKARSGDDQGPGGLFQWKGSRQTPAVHDLVDSGNWKGQIDYALKEDAGPRYLSETAGMNAFDASMWWAREWERPASLQNARNKHRKFLDSYGFQKGGFVGGTPAMLEPGEAVFTPEVMNDMVPRFQRGGSVNMRGEVSQDMSRFRGANNMKRDQSVSTMIMQPIVMPIEGGGGQAPPPPHLVMAWYPNSLILDLI